MLKERFSEKEKESFSKKDFKWQRSMYCKVALASKYKYRISAIIRRPYIYFQIFLVILLDLELCFF
jgi:hypothetical protein